MHKLYKAFLLILIFAISCTPTPKDAVKVEQEVPMYPDYQGVTVPVNIAPLNFLLREDCQAAWAEISYGEQKLVAKSRGNELKFNLKDWKRLLQSASGDSLKVTVAAKVKGHWQEYLPFEIYVSPDSIDPYLTYRLIEPDYEVFSRLQIKERCVEDFTERAICDYNEVGNRCMNCHTYGKNRPDLSFLYVRGEGGGFILNKDGKLRKLSMKTEDMVSGSVYAQFSPDGNWVVFSTNIIVPAFHAKPSKRLEVFDSKSNVYVANLQTNEIMRSCLVVDSTKLATFPTFSPDGNSIYFCMAQGPADPRTLDSLQYSLCRVSFDQSTGSIGNKIDTIVEARAGEKRSVSHPRISPDGKRAIYAVANYGTFPIWHPEADQQMIDLETGEINTLDIVNSEKSDTYHSWSSSGRWFVFASKRDDGLYGKPYFCHIDADGTASKPFVLPQKEPGFYDNNLKSFNTPELGTGQVPFSPADIAAILSTQSEPMQ